MIPSPSEKFEALSVAVLSTRAMTPMEERREVHDWAGRLEESPGEAPPYAMSSELATYLKKVAIDATRVTDGDVQALLAQGVSQDEILELTISAALGTARRRLEHGMRALEAWECV